MAQLDPDLARLVAAWPELPEAIRAGMLEMIDAATSSTEPTGELR